MMGEGVAILTEEMEILMVGMGIEIVTVEMGQAGVAVEAAGGGGEEVKVISRVAG